MSDPIWCGPDLVHEAGLAHVDEGTRRAVFEAFDEEIGCSCDGGHALLCSVHAEEALALMGRLPVEGRSDVE